VLYLTHYQTWWRTGEVGRVSDHNARQLRQRVAYKGFFVVLLAIACSFIAIAPSARALDDPSTETPPASQTLPESCCALLPPEQIPPEGTPVETPSEPAQHTWSPLQLATAAHTNNSALTWSWQAPVSSVPEATFKGYGYSLYMGNALVESGELTPDTLAYNYTATAQGSYRLFVWIIDTTQGETTPVSAECEYKDADYDSTPPVITGDTVVKTGNTATPTVNTDEPSLTYAWTVDAPATSVTVSDATLLTPIFTFLKDGTYTFRLTVTDLAGNTATRDFVVTYLAPFIPNPEAELPESIVPAPVDSFIPVAVTYSQARRQAAAPVYDTSSAPVAPATNQEQAVAQATAKDAPADATSPRPVEASTHGWLLLGVPWYWWLLGIAIIISAARWYRSGAFRKTPDDL